MVRRNAAVHWSTRLTGCPTSPWSRLNACRAAASPRDSMAPFRKTARQKRVLQRQIEAVDRDLDRLVYELCGLTGEEIAIVQEAP